MGEHLLEALPGTPIGLESFPQDVGTDPQRPAPLVNGAAIGEAKIAARGESDGAEVDGFHG
jgi:hypothetical protein